MYGLNQIPLKSKLFKHLEIPLITLATSILIGTSLLALPSNFAPVYIFIGMVLVFFIITNLQSPIFSLLFTLLVIFLPISLIPPEIQSLLNRGVTLLAFGIWLIDLIAYKRKFFLSFSTILMFLFLIWAAISLSWADNFSEGLTVFQTYGLRLVLFLILLTNQIRTKKNLNWFMNTLTISGFFLVIVSLITILLEGYLIGTRLKVLDVNENALGLLLLLTTPGVVWWTMQSSRLTKTVKNIFAGFYFISSIGLIGLSGSRGSAISFGFMVLAFLLWRPTRKWGILSLFIFGLALIVAPFVFSTTIGRFLGAPGETMLGGRESIWPAGWELIKAHLMFGVGIGNSSYRILPYLIHSNSFWKDQSYVVLHNPILVIWAETGLPGLLLYLSVLGSAVFSFIFQFIKAKKLGNQSVLPYFMLVSSMVLGYLFSWIKGGGMESEFSYFLVLALLLIPSHLVYKEDDS